MKLLPQPSVEQVAALWRIQSCLSLGQHLAQQTPETGAKARKTIEIQKNRNPMWCPEGLESRRSSADALQTHMQLNQGLMTMSSDDLSNRKNKRTPSKIEEIVKKAAKEGRDVPSPRPLKAEKVLRQFRTGTVLQAS